MASQSVVILKGFLSCLIPFLAIIIYGLVNKYTSFKKLNKWIRISIAGIVGSVLIFLCYYYGFEIKVETADLSYLGLSALIILGIGILVDYRSAIIATFIGCLYRMLVIPFSSLDMFRWPSILSMIFACAVASFIDVVVQKENKISWLFAFFIGAFVQTFEIFSITLFGLNRLTEVFEAIGFYDVFSIICTGATLSLMIIAMCLINKKSIRIGIKTDNRLIAKVQRRLFVTTVLSFIVSSTASYMINYRKTSSDCSETITSSVNSMAMQVEAYPNPEVIGTMAITPRIMTKGFYIITDSDSEIISIASDKTEKYLGLYFAIQDGYKSREIRDYDSEKTFECVWEGESYLCYYKITADANYNIIGLVPISVIQSTVTVAVRVVMYLLIIIFVILFLLINLNIRRLIVNNIYRINNSLHKITDGDLKEEVDVRDSKEFDELSTDINLTVGALRNYADEINRRLEQDTELAKNIQKNSVINVFPIENGFDVYGYMQTANEAGGDFYDYIKLGNNKVALIIADVVGSGIAPVMCMIQIRSYLKLLFAKETNDKNTDINFKEIIDKTNKEFATNLPIKAGMAMWIGILDIATGKLEYVNCNHIKPLIKQKDGTYHSIECKDNIYIGVDKDFNYEIEHMQLKVGDEILMFNDGIEKNLSKENTPYGVNGIINRLSEIKYFSARQIVQQVSEDINRFLVDATLSDDITLFSFRYTGYQDKRPEHEITLKATPNNTSIATKFVESIMQQYNCSPKSQAIMLIAVDELFSNIAYYAYKGKPEGGNGTIRIEIKGTEFRLLLIDSGAPFNPLSHLDPNYINSSAEDRTNKGGLGIFMVRRSVDDMQYKYENGQNILTIIKNIPEMHEEEFKDSYSTTRD